MSGLDEQRLIDRILARLDPSQGLSAAERKPTAGEKSMLAVMDSKIEADEAFDPTDEQVDHLIQLLRKGHLVFHAGRLAMTADGRTALAPRRIPAPGA